MWCCCYGTRLFYAVPLSSEGPLTGTGRSACILRRARAQRPHSCARGHCLIGFLVPHAPKKASMKGFLRLPKHSQT